MISHRRLVTCLVLLIMVNLVGVATAATPTEVRIGVYEPMTGAMAAGGQMTWEGIELAQKQRPNVLGLPVRLISVSYTHLDVYKRQALDMVEKTLVMMRRGGVYDQIGFGFHRYSTCLLYTS